MKQHASQDWASVLERLGIFLANFKEEKLEDQWRKDDLLELQKQFSDLLNQLQKTFEGMQDRLAARAQLIELWDDDREYVPLTRAMFGMEQYQFYLHIWEELNVLVRKESPADDLYFRVSITAMQLLFLLHIMHEAKIIETPKKGNFFLFISKHIGTAQQDKLSFESLRKKYHTIDRKTVMKVRRLLMDLVNLINTKHL
ncbi:MAG: hypothetical protein M5Z89_15955 [Olivibacter sp.]|jgi:hypothetical protein|uniref:Uncharacterized protein n=1 Tax=Sphingobacterium sp. (strain 21) TaxID=743722 RepID=F4C8U8_SPHS2|nr:hypothetical protein [Olivibacter sp. UJ_SKK_5.1]